MFFREKLESEIFILVKKRKRKHLKEFKFIKEISLESIGIEYEISLSCA